MYIARVYINMKAVDIALYQNYEHFLSDLMKGDDGLLSRVPARILDDIDLSRPRIWAQSLDNTGYDADFVYSYDHRLRVDISEYLGNEGSVLNCHTGLVDYREPVDSESMSVINTEDK